MADVIQSILAKRTTTTGGQFTDFVPASEVLSFGVPGALGDGNSDDTAAIQAQVNTGYCVLAPNTVYLVTSPIQVPSGGTFIGCGFSSRLKCFAASYSGGPGVVQIGTAGADAVNCHVGNFQIGGAGSTVSHTALKCLRMRESYVHDIWFTTSTLAYGFYFDQSCFCNVLSNFIVDPGFSGSTKTFTASVGGATSGTLTAQYGFAGQSYKYPAVFSNGEQRIVTVAANNLGCTWSPALAAGSVTTVSMGAAFLCGAGFNANTCNNFIVNAGAHVYGAYCGDVNSLSINSAASTFNGLCQQTCQVGLYLGAAHSAHTFNSPYFEADAIAPIVLGNFTTGDLTRGHTINTPELGQATSSGATGYGNRVALIDFNNCVGITVNSPCFYGSGTLDSPANGANYPRLVFSGGGSPTRQATGYLVINAAGLPKAAVLLDPGAGYGSNPTVTITGGATGGVGASVAAVQTAGIVTLLTLTAGSGGYTPIGNIPVVYTQASNCTINNPRIISINTLLGCPLYPFIACSAAAVNGSGITINGDVNCATGFGGAGAPYPSTMTVKTSVADKTHYTYYFNGSGAQTAPANAAGTTTWVPYVMP